MRTARALQYNVPLKEFCTLKIGGPAKALITAYSVEEVCMALDYAHAEGMPFLVLGKGSNCLFDDQGFNGLVIVNQISFYEELPGCRVRAGAGYSFSRLGAQTARKGWTGLEFASGIPATVGGAVFMNAGANGRETCESLHSVEYISADGKPAILMHHQLKFGYRSSPFQTMNVVITAVTFQLTEDVQARTAQLEIVRHRTATQPYGTPSAGCFFRNPPGKLAGALIDQAGLKGLKVGDAEVSKLHANFLVNTGDATAKDLLKLAEMVRTRVYETTGEFLEQEVRYIPFDGSH